MSKMRKEYSKIITSIVVAVFLVLAVAFIVFVCYEMHRLGDLSPVAYIGPSICLIIVGVVGFYMWRAKAKSQTDLEWEKTKRLTKLKEKHPEAFTEGVVNVSNDFTNGGI